MNRRRRPGKTYFFGDKVYVKSVRQENLKWFPGEIIKIVSPTTYLVRTEGRTRFVHADHLREDYGSSEDSEVLLPAPVERPKTPEPTSILIKTLPVI